MAGETRGGNMASSGGMELGQVETTPGAIGGEFPPDFKHLLSKCSWGDPGFATGTSPSERSVEGLFQTGSLPKAIPPSF